MGREEEGEGRELIEKVEQPIDGCQCATLGGLFYGKRSRSLGEEVFYILLYKLLVHSFVNIFVQINGLPASWIPSRSRRARGLASGRHFPFLR